MSRFVVVPASYVYLIRDGDDSLSGEPEVLLQLRQGTDYMNGHWAAGAAGHVELGESAVAAAHREVAEEIGVTDCELSFVTTMHRTMHDLPIDERVDFFFTAKRWSGTPRIVEPAKCAALEWFALSQLPSPMVPHEEYLLGLLGQDLTGTHRVPGYTTFGF